MIFRSFFALASVLLCLAIPSFLQSDANGIQIKINAPELTVFDTVTQVIIQRGYSLLTANEKIGLLTTDDRDVKESLGSSLILNLAGQRDVEYMIAMGIPAAPVPLVVKQEENEEAPVTQSVAAPEIKTVEIRYVRIKVAAASIRQSPSIQGLIIKRSSRGDEYRVIGIEGDWCEIMIDEKNVGYINKAVCEQFIKAFEPKPTTPRLESQAVMPPPAPAPVAKMLPASIPEAKVASFPGHSSSLIAHIGLKFGLNSATVDGEALEGLDLDWPGRKLGMILGGFVTFKFSRDFGLQPEILISSKGMNNLADDTGLSWLRLTYIDLPVLAKLFVPASGALIPNIFMGPYFSLLIREKHLDNGDSDLRGDIGSSDFGFVIGAGLDVLKKALKIGSLHLDLRYSIGLISIYDYEGNRARNSALSVLLGFSI
ncbi:MAG: porin family protein [Acidobacteriota bacterium]|nr:porin family protein [Acidobacteriota bacterium]